MRCDLLILRHGQSEWNSQGRWQGQADPPLTTLGERQAEHAADAIAAAALTFDLVLASDLQRAQRTAQIIAARLGLYEVVVDRDLRERDAGEWEGLTRAQINQRWPGDIEARRWPPGFESQHSVAARLLPALTRHLTAANRALLVAHAGVLKTLDALTGLDDERIPNLSGRWFTVTQSDRPDDNSWPALVAGERAQFAPCDERANARQDTTVE